MAAQIIKRRIVSNAIGIESIKVAAIPFIAPNCEINAQAVTGVVQHQITKISLFLLIALFTNSSDMRNYFFSELSSWLIFTNQAATEAVITPMREMPTSIKKTARTRPVEVVGNLSP